MQSHSKKFDDKIKNLQRQIQKLQAQAKNNLAQSHSSKGTQKQIYKKKALMSLNKKKQYQNQLNQLLNHQMTLERMHMNTQAMKNNQQMYNIMSHAANEQKKAMKSIDIDKIDDLQNDMLDMKFDAQYMNQIMGRDYDVDQDQVDDEIAQFQKQIAMDKKKNVNTHANVNVNTNANKNQQPAQQSKNQNIYSGMK